MALTKLFEPVNIGKGTLRNRIAMAPMGTSLATKDGLVTDVMREYYEARARGGAGMIIVESTNIDIRSLNEPNRPLIDSDLTLPGLRRLAAAIKKHGAFAAIQLNHCGGCTKSKVSGYPSLAPSAIIFPAGATKGEMVKELTTEQINEIVGLFAKAAARAKKAGFNGVEIHAAHPYLLAQFLSPFTNHRRDSYGGSLENRARALIEVLTAVRKTVGKDYPVWFRINGQEYGVPDGLTLEDARKVAQMVKGLVDAIHVTSFGYGKAPLSNFPETPGGLLPLAAAIKQVVDVPVIAVGRLDPETGEAALKAGKADIIAMGRRMIADPEIAGKAKSGRLQDIRPCIACFCCHDLGVLKDKPITCAVNPGLAKGNEYEIKPARKLKKIAVIGGGPAGMEAARVLATRGHRVTLFEKSATLGGQLKLAMAAPGKRERIEPLITYLAAQLRKLDVKIKLNTEADVNTISALNPDAVILASGATPVAPKLNGVASSYVVTAFDVLGGREV
ncbi:MAG: FAD-dependent oxidoreductase, partial [Dehalococcoidales bacterium]|nr:FAD-dependent oxidoreductase [Dehalococcoidales bacterium]